LGLSNADFHFSLMLRQFLQLQKRLGFVLQVFTIIARLFGRRELFSNSPKDY